MPSTSNWKEALPLKIVNVLVYIFLFSSNLYSALSPHGHGGKDTAFTPATYVFQIWGVISVLLLGYVIFQFFDGSKDAVHGVGWRFALVGVLNAIFLHTFVTRHFIVAFVFALLVASTVSTIYYSLRAHHSAHGILDVIFIHLPFSLWHAWSVVTVFISAFAAFTHGGHPALATKILVIAAEVFLALTAVGYAFQSRKGDVAGAIVIAWTLFGIYDHQHVTSIRYVALGGFIVSILAIVKSVYFSLEKGGRITLGDEERAPLVG